jgi:hypothetical protein
MDQIVDDLIDKQPIILKHLRIKYWTLERVEKLLKKHPFEIRYIPDSVFQNEIGSLYKLAVDNAKNGIDLIGIAFAFQENNFKEEIFPYILESENVFRLINKGLFNFYYEFDKYKATYIINKFGFDKICKEVLPERVEKIINVLPLPTRLKYKYELKKYLKRSDMDGNK